MKGFSQVQAEYTEMVGVKPSNSRGAACGVVGAQRSAPSPDFLGARAVPGAEDPSRLRGG